MKRNPAAISTLVAVSSGLAALPATALELGEAQVSSSLGQPLRASIAYALAPNETLLSSCVSLQSAAPQNGVPVVGPASITVADGVISIAGKSVIREPLVSMRLNVRCAYTANLSRDYMLFIDPAGTPARAAAAPAAAAAAVENAPVAARRPAVAQRRPVTIQPVAIGSRHRVQPGESLSEIAQNIVDRPVGLWAAVAAIFDANPDAFIDNDPNKLKAGSWLLIPDFAGNAAVVVADTPVFPAEAEADAYEYSEVAADAAAPQAVAEPGAEAPPYVMPQDFIEEAVVSIPDTRIELPAVTSSSPNAATASIRTPAAEQPATNWLLWLAGAGIAVITALLFFGRALRERFGSSPIGAVAVPQRRRSDGDTQEVPVISEIDVEIDALSDTQENLALDADLIIGTGLTQSSDIDVAQDFGFAATTALDMELPEEMSSGVYPTSSTDIIPPLNVDVESILESEVLPDDTDAEDEYDMSVIVDATKMPSTDDVTQKDLAAIPVETGDEALITDDYTVSHEVDYNVLEQDYEDEFTATQALNNEISRAAAELAARMDDEFGSDEDTKEMSLASITALDITAQLPANNDDISDLDDTGINEAVTVNMKDMDGTVEMPADDNTIEMPAKKGRSA